MFPSILQKLAPLTKKPLRDRFVPFLEDACKRYEINTELRLAAFLATICFESDYFKATEEYASGWAYDKSKNPRKAKQLGNTEPGDGPKYKGRGLIQLTGRYNYGVFHDYVWVENRDIITEHSPSTVQNFVNHPERVAQPFWAVESACWYWQTHKLNSYADKGKFAAIQGLVNRGDANKRALDLDKREKLYTTALRAIPDDFSPAPNESAIKPSEAAPAIPDPPKTEDSQAGETFFNKATSWIGEKRSKLTSIGIEPDISGTSKAVVGSVKGTGWSALIYGFLTGNWPYILAGLILVALGVWYFSRSKDRKDARNSTTPQNQQTNVIVEAK
jgi:putative chitinase